MKNKHKKIIVLFVLLLVSCVLMNTVSAAYTMADGTVDTKPPKGSGWGDFAEAAGNIVMTGIGAFIAPLINLLSRLLMGLLQSIFVIGTGEVVAPFPDAVVFNKVPLLDANFINPADTSLIAKMGKNAFLSVFESMRIIAIAIFVIAAMVTGIKLALTTIASKKAQYKEAVMKWLMGFLILVTLKWLLAGTFYLNELLVASLAKTADSMEFRVRSGGLGGRIIGAVLNLFGQPSCNDFTSNGVPGFKGLIEMLYAEGRSGNIIASVATFVILGQTFVVLGAYLKRLFSCILLGLVSPVIVAVDTVTGIVGSKSTIFTSWLKNFMFTVFTQSFNAIYMAVVIDILAQIWATDKCGIQGSYLETIVTIVLITGLVKMEKTLKGLFGFGDGMASLSDGTKGIKKAMAAGAGVIAAGKAIGDNGKNLKESWRQRNAVRKERAGIQANMTASAIAEKNEGKAAIAAFNRGDMDAFHKHQQEAFRLSQVAKGNYVQNQSGGGSDNNSSGSDKPKDYIESVINKQKAQPKTDAEKIAALNEAEKNISKKVHSAGLATLMSVPNLAAGIGMGLGMGEDIGESLFKGGMITAGLDHVAEKIGSVATSAKYKKEDKMGGSTEQKKDAIKYGYDESTTTVNRRTENVRNETTATTTTTTDTKLTLDMTKINKDLDKAFRDLGHSFGDEIKRVIKNVDKDLDNE